MLSSHTLADNLSVLVNEDIGLSSSLVHSSLGEGDEGRVGVLGQVLL
jgi:hypothetical protein